MNKRNIFCVGLIGNIGSGKSTVAAEFSKLGVDVISADQVAKKLTEPNQPAFQKIVDHFGTAILTDTGELNRRKLRQLIITHKNERFWLEALLHPLIRQQIARQVHQCKSAYCLIEIPLLPNKSQYPYLNRILLILAEPEQQITRLMARDASTREAALAILATQADETSHRAIADDILMNHGSLVQLQAKVKQLHHQYLQASA